MTVRELMEILEMEDQDKEIYFTYPSGDHWHTVIAKPVKDIEEGYIEESSYHNAFRVIQEEPDEYDEKEGVKLLIS